MRFFLHFQNESYIPQLFTRKFLSREPKCLNGVVVGDWDALTTREIAPIGAISRLCRVLYQVEGVVLMAGTNNLRNKKVTPESLFETLCNSIDKIRTVYDSKLFICKIPPRLDLAFVDSKIARYNDLISLGLKLSNVLLIETIDRELKFFSRDGLHLNKRKGCVALAGIILSSLYSILRPSCKKAARRPRPSFRPLRGHLRWGHGDRPRPKSGHKNEEGKQGSKATSVVQQGSGPGHRDFPLSLALICVMMMTGVVELVTCHQLQSDSLFFSSSVSLNVNKSVSTLNPTDELVIGCWNMRGSSSGQL